MTHPDDSECRHKPSNWWAIEREPWKRIGRELAAHADALAARRTADAAIVTTLAFIGCTLTGAAPPGDGGQE